MTDIPLTMRIPSFAAMFNIVLGIMDGYRSKIQGFSRNARMFLIYIFLTSLSLGIYGVIFNLYILRLGLGEELLGLLLSLVSISTGLFAIPASMACDRIGRKNTLVVSCLLLLISFFFLYTATSPLLLAVFSFLYGVSSALKIVTASTFMTENSSGYERMHLFSMYHLLYTVAVMIGNLVGGVLPQLLIDRMDLEPAGALSYQITLYTSLIAVFFSLLPLLFIRDEKIILKKGKGIFSSLSSSLRSDLIRKLVIVNALIGIGWGLALPYFNVYFDVVLAASSKQIGLIFSLSQVFRSLALLLVPLLTERFGKVRMIAIVQFASIPFLILFASTHFLILAALGYVMRDAIMNMSNPVSGSFTMEMVQEDQRATVNSLTWMSCYIFVGLSTYIGGLIIASGHYTLPFYLTCVVYFVATVLYYVYFEKVERAQGMVG